MNIQKPEVLKLKVELEEKQIAYKKIEKEKLENEKEFKKIIKELKSEISSNKLVNDEFNNIKLEVEKCSKQKRDLLKERNDLKEKNETTNKLLKETKKELNAYQEKVKNTELYYKYNFLQDKNEKIFGIIHSIDINIVKVIFSEVEFIDIKDWKNRITNVKKIYIQREGIPTRELSKIRNYCVKNGIEIKESISIYDEKRLIEIVSMIKNNY